MTTAALTNPAVTGSRRVARALHPGAWWVWAIGLAAVAARTTNPLLLLLVLGVAAQVVAARRSDAPWADAFGMFLRLGLVVIAIRVVAQTVFGADLPGEVVITLPELPLPAWAAGVTFGGPVTDQALLAAVVDGLRLATVLACVGAANALASPKRLLASLPAALYEVGVAAVVALSFAPSLMASVRRIRSARRLRGRSDRGLRSIAAVALPVLEDALERSLSLAAAMDSRGYGRRAAVPPATRRLTAALTLLGLGGILVGVYGLMDGTGPAPLAIGSLAAGVVAATGGMALGGRRAVRSRYRPDPWRAAEWGATAAGIAAAAGSIISGLLVPEGMHPPPGALASLALPWAGSIGVLLALLPAWTTPPARDTGSTPGLGETGGTPPLGRTAGTPQPSDIGASPHTPVDAPPAPRRSTAQPEVRA